MGVTTRADEIRRGIPDKLEPAIKSIQEAKEDIEKILDPDTWGSEDYTQEFIKSARKDLLKLSKMRHKLMDMRNKY